MKWIRKIVFYGAAAFVGWRVALEAGWFTLVAFAWVLIGFELVSQYFKENNVAWEDLIKRFRPR